MQLVGWLTGWLAGWLAVWLSGSLAACMVGWLNVAGGEGDAAGEGEGWKDMMGDREGGCPPCLLSAAEIFLWGPRACESRSRPTGVAPVGTTEDVYMSIDTSFGWPTLQTHGSLVSVQKLQKIHSIYVFFICTATSPIMPSSSR